MLSVTLAVAALALSLVSFVSTYRAGHEEDRRSRMPVLVFIYDARGGWTLRNVGNGAALNVLVAQKHAKGDVRGQWYRPVRVPPIVRDHEVVLKWIEASSDFGLGATYEDFLGADKEDARGRTYTVTCGNDLNQVRPGRVLPVWPEAQIQASWQMSS